MTAKQACEYCGSTEKVDAVHWSAEGRAWTVYLCEQCDKKEMDDLDEGEDHEY